MLVESIDAECLSCGKKRVVARPDGRQLYAGECPRCGYVGWAPAADLTERVRRLLREAPLPERRVSAA